MNSFRKRKSPRADWWDYSSAGAYFITICTLQFETFFGEIIDKQMILSKTGIIADLLWHQIPYHAKNVDLGSFVVMPNHIHGILVLNPSTDQTETNDNLAQGRFQNQGKNTVSSIIGSYKSAVTRHVNRLGACDGFQWQPRFYDNIIRDEKSYDYISKYIETNVENWHTDMFFPKKG
ncbi:transposase [Hugenholtzia roseola]|uniref:transposase n=1 Tax=Hugenholtzia roseola TaxID=1002 RepID=UPI000479E377|nr:transposase [Hugenholtzia roseola]